MDSSMLSMQGGACRTQPGPHQVLESNPSKKLLPAGFHVKCHVLFGIQEFTCDCVVCCPGRDG